MRKIKEVLAVFVVLFCLAVSEAKPEPEAEKRISESTLRVGNETGMGSGTVVHKSGDTIYLLTCKHVVNGKNKVFVVANRKLHTGTVYAVSKTNDLALVRVELKGFNPVGIAADDVKSGDAVFHHGLATGPVDGKITGETLFADAQGKVWNSDAMCVAGDSGGGFYHKGELIGVLCGRIHIRKDDPEAGETFFVPLPKVKAFLKENLPE